MDSFPPNSRKSADPPPPRKLERVTTVPVKQRRTPLGRMFSRTFFSGDAKSAAGYMLESVIMPGIQNMLFEAGTAGFERLVFGDSRIRRGAPPRGNPNLGRVDYSSMHPAVARPPGPTAPPMMTRQARARHDFNDLVIPSRREAEEVLDRMYDLLAHSDVVVLAEMYELVGIDPQHTDYKWGWQDLHGARIGRARGGYVLDLPEPKPL